MRFILISLLSVLTISLFVTDTFSQSNSTTKQYVAVSKAFVNVYKDLDPKSMVVGQAKKGDHLPLIAVGNAWYKVKMSNTEGWLDKRAGEVVDSASSSTTVLIIIVLLIVAVAISGISWYLYKSDTNGSST